MYMTLIQFILIQHAFNLLHHQGAVQVLSMIQDVLPAVASINSKIVSPVTEAVQETNGSTTSQHYAVIESDHPYKAAQVANYKVRVKVTCWQTIR